MGQGPSEPPVCRPLFAMLASKTALRLRLLFPSLDASERASESCEAMPAATLLLQVWQRGV